MKKWFAYLSRAVSKKNALPGQTKAQPAKRKRVIAGFTPLEVQSKGNDSLRKRQRRFLSLTGFTPLEMQSKSNDSLRKRQRRFLSLTGFTLIEVLLTAAILSLVMGGIFAVLNVGLMSWHSDMGLLDLQQELRRVMDGMVRELRQADPSRDADIGQDGSSIQFYISDISSPITYSLSNNQVFRLHPATNSMVLANDVNLLSFCWVHSSGSCTTDRDCGGSCSKSYSLKVALRAAKTVRQRALIFPLLAPLSEEVRLRNE